MKDVRSYLGRRGGAGFALPMVLLLVMVGGIMIAFMLERQSGQSLIVNRQLDAYQSHHIGRGFREAIEAWLTSNGTTKLSESLDGDGHAFDLAVDTGSRSKAAETVRVSMYDGQGTILADLTGITGQSRELGQAILDRLREDARRESPAKIRAMIRRDGPLAVSAGSASPEVLQIVAAAATDGERGDEVAKEVMRARESGILDITALNDAFSRAGVSPEARIKLGQAFVPEANLWRIEAEVVRRFSAGASGGRVDENEDESVRYGGWAMIRSGRGGGGGPGLGGLGGGNVPQSRTAMISWERLGPRSRDGR